MGLTSNGEWSNPQYVAEAVDPTGLTFEVEYVDGSHASVSPQSHSPSTWGDTAGTQTCTFTYTEDGESVSCDVDAIVSERPQVLSITGVSVSGTQTNCNVQDARFRPTGLIFTFTTSDGQTVTSAASGTATGEVDYNWTNSDARESSGCSIVIDDVTGDPTSVVTYEASSSYFNGVGSITLTIRPNEDCLEALGLDGYEIAESAYTTLTLTVIQSVHLVGTIDDSLQIQFGQPDLTGVTVYAYGSQAAKDPETGLPGSDGSVVNNPSFNPAQYITSGSQTLEIYGFHGAVPYTTTVSVQAASGSGKTITTLDADGSVDWESQEVGEDVDLTGLTVCVNYSDGEEEEGIYISGNAMKDYVVISGSHISNGQWTQVDTSENITITVDDSVSGFWVTSGFTVDDPAPSTTVNTHETGTVISVTVTGTGSMASQTAGSWPDYTGLTFTYGLSNGSSIVLTGGAGVYTDDMTVASETGNDLDASGMWVDPLPASSTIEITAYAGDDGYWAVNGYEVADPAPSTSVTFS